MVAGVFTPTDRPEPSANPEPEENDPLQTGFLALGPVNAPTGEAWGDKSSGVDYGSGQRYAHEETYYMAKVQGHRSKLNGAG